ncbi:MAG TPA: ATP-binding protein [Candidatus Saccharimonadales bacterium]|nr:ATP-binding protein [Candidatus Saccharimonadales bacterium]
MPDLQTANPVNVDPAKVNIEHQRLASLINSMSDSVIAVDENCLVVLYNAATLNILDINTAIETQPLHKVLKIYNKDNEPVDIESLVTSTKIPTSTRNYLLHYTDNSSANLYLSIAPVHLGYGQVGQQGYVLVMRDITREKSLEEERDEFISVVSHELRTPITIAEGNISNAQFVANKTGDIEKLKPALEEAHRQILFLADMINDLATLSRAERAKLTFEISAINAHDIVQNLVNSYRSEAKSKGLELKAEIDPRLELLQSSELYVREILQNFVTNSLKYTQTGAVTVGARQQPGGVEFWVSDTGIGISKTDQQNIFNKFFRSEDYRTKETKGTGLGLYITRKLATLIKAAIHIQSELNKGSVFTIFVPNLR